MRERLEDAVFAFEVGELLAIPKTTDGTRWRTRKRITKSSCNYADRNLARQEPKKENQQRKKKKKKKKNSGRETAPHHDKEIYFDNYKHSGLPHAPVLAIIMMVLGEYYWH